jgi:transposase-like protein
VADDLKGIYQAPSVGEAERRLAQFEETWNAIDPVISPVISRSWRSNWARGAPMFS